MRLGFFLKRRFPSMSRFKFLCGAFLLAGSLALVGALAAVRAEDKQPAPSLAAKLAKTVKFEGIEPDPKLTLQEVLDKLGKDNDVAFDVNEEAFRNEMVEDILGKPVAERAVPKLTNVRLEAVLRKVLGRLPSQSGVTYLIRPGVIEITTMEQARQEIWPAGYTGPFLPLVHGDFQRKPLAEALKELAEGTGFNVVVDPRVGEKAQTAVSATMTNVPLDTAVGVLADMADLKPFPMDNVLYVTTPANAAKLEEHEKQRQTNDPNAAPRIGSGQGPGSRRAASMQ
jgi:hypothetical protein